MKFTNYEIVNALSILRKFTDNKFPQKISYAITRNIKVFDNEYKEYQAQLQKILDEYKDYVVTDENGVQKVSPEGIPLVSEDKMGDYVSDINELLDCTSDVAVHTVPDDAFDYDDARFDCITPNDILMLQEIMCERKDKS